MTASNSNLAFQSVQAMAGVIIAANSAAGMSRRLIFVLS
jgi:hypothetical protein